MEVGPSSQTMEKRPSFMIHGVNRPLRLLVEKGNVVHLLEDTREAWHESKRLG